MLWQIGKLIQQERYRIEQELGRGGFGITYKVKELRTNKLFVIKTLNDVSQQKENFQELQVKFIRLVAN